MPQIEHVVVLMLENRSFDNLMGWLYNAADPPQHIIGPADQPQHFQGLDGIHFTNPTAFVGGRPIPAVEGTQNMCIPTPDPNEKFKHMNQQLFGANVAGPNWLPPRCQIVDALRKSPDLSMSGLFCRSVSGRSHQAMVICARFATHFGFGWSQTNQLASHLAGQVLQTWDDLVHRGACIDPVRRGLSKVQTVMLPRFALTEDGKFGDIPSIRELPRRIADECFLRHTQTGLAKLLDGQGGNCAVLARSP